MFKAMMLIGLLSSGIPFAKTTTEDVKVSSVEVVFNTTTNDKDHDTYLDVVLKRPDDIVIGEQRHIGGKWNGHSSHSVQLPVRGVHYRNEIGGTMLLLHIDCNGNDKWEFDYTVIIHWSDGSKTEKTITGTVMAQDSPDAATMIL